MKVIIPILSWIFIPRCTFYYCCNNWHNFRLFQQPSPLASPSSSLCFHILHFQLQTVLVALASSCNVPPSDCYFIISPPCICRTVRSLAPLLLCNFHHDFWHICVNFLNGPCCDFWLVLIFFFFF